MKQWIASNEAPGVKFLASWGHLFTLPLSSSTYHSDTYWPKSTNGVGRVWHANDSCGYTSLLSGQSAFRPAFVISKDSSFNNGTNAAFDKAVYSGAIAQHFGTTKTFHWEVECLLTAQNLSTMSPSD
jgi:hypothetical protein